MHTPAAPDPLLAIVFEDDELLVVNKPAGLVCHPTKGDVYSSLISRVRLHFGAGGAPRLVNRLDRETSGLVVVAKTLEAAAELGRLWESRTVAKTYLALVHGHPVADTGLIEAPLGPDENSPVAIKDCVRADGAPASTAWHRLGMFTQDDRPFALLRVEPWSGRKHQIRIHLAHLGHPIVGDKIYGGDPQIYLDFVTGRLTPEQARRLLLPHQALHAAAVRLTWRGVERVFRAPPEPWFHQFAGAATMACVGADLLIESLHD